MKRSWLIISFVLISLLAIGAVSATDDYNVSDDSLLSEQVSYVDDQSSVDVDNIEDDSTADEVVSISEEQTNQSDAVLSESDVNTITEDEDSENDVLSNDGDSGDAVDSDDVLELTASESNILAQDELNTGELIAYSESNTVSSIYDSIINYNSSNSYINNIIDGFVNIYNLAKSINISMFFDALDEISSFVEINFTEIFDGFENSSFITNISNVFDEMWDTLNISGTFSYNSSALIGGLEDIFNEFNLTNEDILDVFDQLIADFNLNISDAISTEINNTKAMETLNMTSISGIFDDIIEYNNLTFIGIIGLFSNLTNESSLNLSNIIKKIKNSDFNSTKIINSLSDIFASVITINNSSKLSEIIDGFNTIYDAFRLNVTSIYESTIEILDGIVLNLTELELNSSDVLNEIWDFIKTFNFTEKMDEIVEQYNETKILSLGDIVQFLDDFFDNNNYTMENTIELLSNLTDGFYFNLLEVINFIKDFDLNSSSINDTFYKILATININATKIFTGLGDLIDNFDINETLIYDGFSEIVNATGFYIDTISDALSKLGEINITAGILEFKDIILNSTHLSFSKLIDGMAYMVLVLVNYTETFEEIFNQLENITSNATAFISDVIDVAIDIISNVTDILSDIISDVISNVTAFISDVADVAKDVISNVTEFIDDVVDVATDVISNVTDVIGDVISDVSDVVSDVVSDITDTIGNIIDNVKKLIPNVTDIILDVISDVEDVISNVTDVISDVGEAISDFVTPIYDEIVDYIYDLFGLKANTTITASDLSIAYGNSKNLVITLKNADGNVLSGKSVTVTLNGATYNLTTNANGQASIAVPKNLAPKTYTATLAFAGDSTTLNSTGSAKVVVTKLSSKLTAKKKTFKKAKKTKKYKVTLKSGSNVIKNVKLTIKIKGKTFKATTNSKGKATFKIKKLTKKGKYKATVTFKGNSIYKATSKKVKITLK